MDAQEFAGWVCWMELKAEAEKKAREDAEKKAARGGRGRRR